MNGKRKLKVRRSVYILMSLCLTAVLLGGCGKKQIQKTDNEEEVVEIPMILTVSPTSGSSIMIAVISPHSLPYRLRKYSGTVLTVAARNLGATKLKMMNAIPMVVIYQDALRPKPDIPF